MEGMGEQALRGPTRDHLEARGYEVFDEVPIGGRLADLLGVGEGSVAAVELKLAQWRGALRQARAYQLGAHYASIAVPLPLALRLGGWPSPFEDEGIGLLGVDAETGEVRELVAARPSRRFLPFVSERAVELARTRGDPLPPPPMASLLAELWQATG